MKDQDLMKFGKFKGEAMANVPAWWLVWFWDENIDNWLKKSPKVLPWGIEVMEYIKETGIDHLRKEAKSAK